MAMDETDFERLAGETLAAVARAVEASGAACECEPKGDGVLEIDFENGSKIIVNRHGAAREIWVAARSGGYHFRFDGNRWVGTRDGMDLFTCLSRCVGEQAGSLVQLVPSGPPA